MNKEILDLLTKFIMNERQAKVYMALLKENIATASELYRISGVPQNKIYEILKFLMTKGFVSKKMNGTHTLYEVIDPKNSIEQVIEKHKAVLEEMYNLKEQLIQIYNSTSSEKALSEYIEVIYGNENVHKKFIELLNKMKHKGLSISCPPYVTINAVQRAEQKEAAEAFFKRGGKDKSIREINADTPAFIFDSIRSTLNDYEPADNRIISKSPIKLFIFDEEVLMTFNKSFIQAGDEICASIIKQPNTVKTYIHMFNFLFDQAEPFDNWIKTNQELYNQKLAEYDEEKQKNNGGRNA